MNTTAVESTTLATVAYDGAVGMLQLEFRSRAIYQYFDVPVGVHEELLEAASKGTYFNRVVRGHFPYRLILHAEAGTSDESLRPEGAR
jgi:KTSC domain